MDYLRGAACVLCHRYSMTRGMSGMIEGSLPIGGLSSSAAVVLCYVMALAGANGISLSEAELIDIVLAAETEYVGVSIGKLDQSCEVYCRKGQLLYLDTKDDTYRMIQAPEQMPDYEIAVFYSGVSRNLMGSAFNMRVDEAKSAAYALKALEGIPYGRFMETRLRDVPEEVFLKWEDRLPELFANRARYFYSEYRRVEEGAVPGPKGIWCGSVN